MSTVDQVLSYLAIGNASAAAMADALNTAETSIARALAHLEREDRVASGTIYHAVTGAPITVWRATPEQATPSI